MMKDEEGGGKKIASIPTGFQRANAVTSYSQEGNKKVAVYSVSATSTHSNGFIEVPSDESSA